jgi:protein-disulfide isomerase/uncharacterized membrane protein
MARTKPMQHRGGGAREQVVTATLPAAAGVSMRTYVGGILLLALSTFGSLMLALEHLGGLSLPGCGPGSGCAEAAASVWAQIPYLNWPVSFLGAAYFLGLLGVWLTSRRGVPGGVRYLVRLGVLISLGFVAVMIVEGHLCQYCVMAHVGNIAFWIVAEGATRVRAGSVRGLATVAAIFVVCSGALGVAEWRGQQAAEAKAEADLAASTDAIISATSQRAVQPEEASTAAVPVEEPAAGGPVEEPTAAGPQEPERPSKGFTGRYRLGPEKAAIRVVMISDYQCVQCRRIEYDVMRVFRQRDDMSVSFKHYPMCSDCNRNAGSRRHPNACWAARAAETAGILKGNDGFWEMHAWLFEQRGSFTRESLSAKLQELGYDPDEFVRIMSSDETLELVKADVEEAIGLGVWFTPTPFINGVELRGWEAPNAVERAVERLAATNPEPQTAAHDQPPAALEKLIGDWQAMPQRQIPPGPAFRSIGPADAAVRVVMFGDYMQSGTADTDALIRAVLAQRDDMRYEYRHFPFNRECNSTVKRDTEFVHSCQAARAGEAAGRLGGSDAYWKMHAWLLANQESYSEQALRAAAETLGIDPAALLLEMQKPATDEAVREDARLGGQVAADKIPSLFINGRRVLRWMQEGQSVLPEIIAEAARE